MTGTSDFDPDKEHGPIAWMAKNPVASNVLILILIVGGLVAGSTLLLIPALMPSQGDEGGGE